MNQIFIQSITILGHIAGPRDSVVQKTDLFFPLRVSTLRRKTNGKRIKQISRQNSIWCRVHTRDVCWLTVIGDWALWVGWSGRPPWSPDLLSEKWRNQGKLKGSGSRSRNIIQKCTSLDSTHKSSDKGGWGHSAVYAMANVLPIFSSLGQNAQHPQSEGGERYYFDWVSIYVQLAPRQRRLDRGPCEWKTIPIVWLESREWERRDTIPGRTLRDWGTRSPKSIEHPNSLVHESTDVYSTPWSSHLHEPHV